MQVLKLEYRILFAGVLARSAISSLCIFASQRVVEQVPVVVLPVGVAGKPEQSRNRDNENAWAVEWIDVAMEMYLQGK